MNAQPSLFAPAAPPAPHADDDADVRAAVAEFTPSVLRIRELSALVYALPAARDRAAVEEEVQSLVADIATRAARLALTVDDLFRLINAELANAKGDTKRPHGDFLRHLLDEATGAYGDRRQVEREVERMKANLALADDRCVQADRACAGFVAGWAQRGGAR